MREHIVIDDIDCMNCINQDQKSDVSGIISITKNSGKLLALFFNITPKYRLIYRKIKHFIKYIKIFYGVLVMQFLYLIFDILITFTLKEVKVFVFVRLNEYFFRILFR